MQRLSYVSFSAEERRRGGGSAVAEPQSGSSLSRPPPPMDFLYLLQEFFRTVVNKNRR